MSEDIVQLAITMTEMDTGINLSPQERENMIIKISDNQDRTGLFNIKIKLYEIFRKLMFMYNFFINR